MPSDNEWEQLAQYVADQTGSNGKSGDDWTQLGVNLKATSGWNIDTGTDDFGFSALPAGKYDGGSFYSEGNFADFWSATEYAAARAWFRNLGSGSEYLNRYHYNESSGYSSRCVQDF